MIENCLCCGNKLKITEKKYMLAKMCCDISYDYNIIVRTIVIGNRDIYLEYIIDHDTTEIWRDNYPIEDRYIGSISGSDLFKIDMQEAKIKLENILVLI